MAHYPYNDIRFECTLSDSLTSGSYDNRYTATGVYTPAVAVATWEGTKEPMLRGMVPANPTNLRYADIINHVYSPTRNTAFYYNNQVIQYSSVLSPIRLVYMMKFNEFVLSSCSVGCLHPDGVIFLCNNNTVEPYSILVYEINEEPYVEYRVLENYPKYFGATEFCYGHYYDEKFYMSNNKIYDLYFNEIDDILDIDIARTVWYISNNPPNHSFVYQQNGTTHFYSDFNINSTSVSPANISYQWKANLWSSADFLQVRLVPTSTTPLPGTTVSGGTLIGEHYGNATAAQNWQQVNVNLGVMNGNFRLVFTFRTGSGYNSDNGFYPPCISNVIVRTNTGPNVVQKDWIFVNGELLNKWHTKIENFYFNEKNTMYGYNGNKLTPHVGDGKFLIPYINLFRIYDATDNSLTPINTYFPEDHLNTAFYLANNCLVGLYRNNSRMILTILDLDTNTVKNHDLGQNPNTFNIWYIRPTQCRRYVNISTTIFYGNPSNIRTGYSNNYSFFVLVDTFEKRMINRTGSISGARNTHFMHTAFAFVEYDGEFVSAHTKMVDGNALHRICDVPVIVGDRVYTYGTVGDNVTPIFPVYFVDKVTGLRLLETKQNSYMQLTPNSAAPNSWTMPDLGYNYFSPSSGIVNYIINYNGDIYRVGFSNIGSISNGNVSGLSMYIVVSRYNVASYSWDIIERRNILDEIRFLIPYYMNISPSTQNPTLTTPTTLSNSGNRTPLIKPIHLYQDEDCIIVLARMDSIDRFYRPSSSYASNVATNTYYRIFKFNKLTFEIISSEYSTLQIFSDSSNASNPDFFGTSSVNMYSYISYDRFLIYMSRNAASPVLRIWIYDIVTNINHYIVPSDWSNLISGLSATDITNFRISYVKVNENTILTSWINQGAARSFLIEYDLSTGVVRVLNHNRWGEYGEIGNPIIPSLGGVYKILDRIYVGSSGSFTIYDTDYNLVGSVSGANNLENYSKYYEVKYSSAAPTYLILTNNRLFKDDTIIPITGIDIGYTVNSHFYLDGMSCVLANHSEYNPRIYRLNQDFSVTFLHEYDEITNITPTNNTANISTHVLYDAHLPASMPFKRVASNVSTMSYVLPMRNHDSFYLVSNSRGGVMKHTGPTTFTLTNAPIDEINYTHCGIGTKTKLLHGTVEGNPGLRRWRKWEDETGTGVDGIVELSGDMLEPSLVTNNTCNDRIYVFHSGNIYKYDPDFERISPFFTLPGNSNINQYDQHAEHRDGRFYFVRDNEIYRESDDLTTINLVLTNINNIRKVVVCPGDLIYYASTRSVYSFNTTTGVETLLGTTRNNDANTMIMDITLDNNNILWGVTGSTNSTTSLCTVFDMTTGSWNEYDAKYRSNLVTGAETNIRGLCRIIFEPYFNRRFLFTNTANNPTTGTNYTAVPNQAYYWSDLYGNYILRGGNTISGIGMIASNVIWNWRQHLFLYKDFIFCCGSTAVIVWRVTEYGNFVASEFDFQMGKDKSHYIPYLPNNYNSPFQPARIENMHTSDITDVINDQYISAENSMSQRYSRSNYPNRYWNNHVHFGRREVVKNYNGLPLNTLIVTNKLRNADRLATINIKITGSPGVAYIHWGLPVPGLSVTEVFETGNTAVTTINLTGEEIQVSLNYRARNVHCIGIFTNSSITSIKCVAGHVMQFDTSKNGNIREIDVSGNLLFEYELNSMFRGLPTVDYGVIRIGGNPHVNLCDKNIAINKGWAVFGGEFFGYTGVINITGNWTATSFGQCYPIDSTTLTPTIQLSPNYGENSVTQAIGQLIVYGSETTPLQTSGPLTLIDKTHETPYGGIKINFVSGPNTIVVDIIYGEVQGSIEEVCFLGSGIVSSMNVTITVLEI